MSYGVTPASHGATQLPVPVIEWYTKRMAITSGGITPTVLVQAEDLPLVAQLARGLQLCPDVVLEYSGADTMADVKLNMEVACSTAPV